MFTTSEFRRRVAQHITQSGQLPTCVYLGTSEIAGLKQEFQAMTTIVDPRLKEVFAWKGVVGEIDNPLFVMGIEVFAVNRQQHCRFVTVMEPKV